MRVPVMALALFAVGVLAAPLACGGDSGPNCGPDSCAGCCIDGACANGNTPGACGTGGVACLSCPAGQVCESAACAPCDGTTCAGCCDGSGCRSGDQDRACGRGGEACRTCADGTYCSSPTTECLTSLGIGDICESDEQCESEYCSPVGWCNHYSGCESNAGCAGSGPEGRNTTNGFANYCIRTTDGYECFPGCSSSADCSSYERRTCSETTSIGLSSVHTCSRP
jgi:hypothetical protein